MPPCVLPCKFTLFAPDFPPAKITSRRIVPLKENVARQPVQSYSRESKPNVPLPLLFRIFTTACNCYSPREAGGRGGGEGEIVGTFSGIYICRGRNSREFPFLLITAHAGKDASAGSHASSTAKFNNGSLSGDCPPPPPPSLPPQDSASQRFLLRRGWVYLKGTTARGCGTNTLAVFTPRAPVRVCSLRTPVADGMGKVDVVFVIEIYPPNNVMQTSLLNRI